MQTFTAETQKAVASTPNPEIQSSSAQLPNGSHVVVWNVETGSLPDWPYAIRTPYAQIFDASGNAVGAPVQLFSDVATSGGALATGVSALADGTIVVAGSTYKVVVNVGPVWTVYSERLSASGQVLATKEVNSWTANDARNVVGGDVFVAPDGSYYVDAQVSERAVPQMFYSNVFQHYDAAGNAIGAKFYAGSDYGDFPSEVVMASGNILTASFFVSAGAGPDSIIIDAYDTTGQVVKQQVIRTADVDRNVPSAVALAGDKALVIWHEFPRPSTGESIHAQIVDGAGNLVGSPYAIALPAGENFHLTALADGGALASWQSSDGGDWSAQYIAADGRVDGAIFGIGTGVSEITATADGGFLVESSHGGDAYEQKFDAGPDASAAGTIDVQGGITAIPTGNYAISGSAGIDQVAFAGAHTQYAVTRDTVSSTEGFDSISGIERVRFSDGYAVALDVNGNAGQAYRLYQAAFDRHPDLPGLGFQMNDLDMGYSLVHVAQNFIDSPEFQRTYGPDISNQEFITLLYRNVLNREPEQAGMDYHMNEFAQGETRAGMLTHFSEAPENQANVIGQIQDGMLFVPYA